MAEELHAQLAEKLEAIGPAVAIALEFKVDSYFDVVRGLVDDFAAKKGLSCVYITASVPAVTLSNALEALEADTKLVRFVDCVSHSLMSKTGSSDKIAYVESPTMLEYIALKTEYFGRQAQGRKALVILDSMNSLALHNDSKMLSEFLTILLNSLKAKEAYPVVLSLPDSLRPDAKEILSLVSDTVLSV